MIVLSKRHLRRILTAYFTYYQARALEDSSSRRIARRVLGPLRASTAGGRNPELRTLLNRISAVVPR